MAKPRNFNASQREAAFLERLRHYLDMHGVADRQVSLAITGKPDFIRDLFRSGNLPRADNLQALAAYLGVTTEQLMLGDGAEPLPKPMASVQTPTRPFNPRELPKNVPVFTGALGTAYDFSNGVPVESQVMNLGEAVDMVRRPPGLTEAKGIYALYIAGDSQSPRFETGELIFVHPHRPCGPGDDVVVQVRDDHDEVVCALVKRLVRRTNSVVTLRQFNPPTEFDVPAARIHAIHRILSNADLWGF